MPLPYCFISNNVSLVWLSCICWEKFFHSGSNIMFCLCLLGVPHWWLYLCVLCPQQKTNLRPKVSYRSSSFFFIISNTPTTAHTIHPLPYCTSLSYAMNLDRSAVTLWHFQLFSILNFLLNINEYVCIMTSSGKGDKWWWLCLPVRSD